MTAGGIRRWSPGGDLGPDPGDRIAALVDGHGATLLRVARRHSLCLDDAQDAYQRALEIYLRRLDTVEPATEGAWMRVVVRHEAMAVRRGRAESVAGDDIDFDAHVDETVRPLEELLAAAERSSRSAEVLRRLKPDEATALMLKAEGHSYDEIAQREGWTYTKVNRAITEGRRRFLKTYADLESGDGCEAFGPNLAALAAGTATADAMLGLRPHLRHCPACRATVRELRGGRRRAAAWLPLPALLAGLRRRSHGEPLDYERNLAEVGGSGFASPQPPPLSPGRWVEIKLHLQNLLHRFSGSDVATSAQVAASGGGGRATTIAALIGVCLSGVGAGTYCVATLILPTEPVDKPRVHRVADRPAKPKLPAKPASTPVAVVPTPTSRAVAIAAPAVRRQPRRIKKRSASVASHESSPPPAPAAAGQQELSFEQSDGGAAAAQAPAAASATGGDEFSP